MNPATCRSCQARIVWVMTTKRKRMPLDATQDGEGRWVPLLVGDGNVADTGRTAFGGHGEQVPVVQVVAAGVGRWRSHFASCENAGQHRRKR